MKLVFLTSLFVTNLVKASKDCTLNDDIKYMYAQCNADTGMQKVFFYYPPVLNCAPHVESERGDRGSHAVPPYQEVKCQHRCQDGEMSYIQFYPNMRQECKQCPKNEISIDGGLIIDAKMDDELHLTEMVSQHFKMGCLQRMGDESISEQGCDPWQLTGQSLKTP